MGLFNFLKKFVYSQPNQASRTNTINNKCNDYFNFFNYSTGQIKKITYQQYKKIVYNSFGNIPEKYLKNEIKIYEYSEQIANKLNAKELNFLKENNRDPYYRFNCLQLPNIDLDENTTYGRLVNVVGTLIKINPSTAWNVLLFIDSLPIYPEIGYKLIFYETYAIDIWKYYDDNLNIQIGINIALRLFDIIKHNINTIEFKNSYSKILIKLCNNLYKIGKSNEAIEIATFCLNHDFKDTSKGGWEGRINKFKKERKEYNEH